LVANGDEAFASNRTGGGMAMVSALVASKEDEGEGSSLWISLGESRSKVIIEN